MDEDALKRLEARLDAQAAKRKRALNRRADTAMALERTELTQDAPAPQTQGVIAKRGLEPTEMALCAWEHRVKGGAIVDCAHTLGVTIETAKLLLKEAHDAIHEDLKQNLELNRQLDLDRVDGLLKAYYPLATQGDVDAAGITLKCLSHRSKLTGIEPPPDPGRSQPQNVLLWVQNALPSIHKIVDALPAE